MRASRISGLMVLAGIGLAACGGGAVIAVLGSLGVGAGDYLVDANPATRTYEARTDCGAPDACSFSINPVTAARKYLERDYAVTVTDSNFSACPVTTAGRVTDDRVAIPGCIVGRALSVNEIVSDDGLRRIFHNFDPELERGVWVDIQDDTHRFKFNDNFSGCEFVAGVKQPVAVTVEISDFGAPSPKVNATTIKSLVSQHRPGTTYTGAFVSAGSVRLSGGGGVIELERRDLVANCL